MWDKYEDFNLSKRVQYWTVTKDKELVAFFLQEHFADSFIALMKEQENAKQEVSK